MERSITTIGTGWATGTPDAMRLSVAVVVHADSVQTALARAASSMGVLGEVARRFTESDQISSTALNLWSRTDQQGRSAGFEVRHAVSIRCQGMEAAGDLVTHLASELGDVMTLEGIEPILTDTGALATSARTRAWVDARAKAEELARLAESRLGGVLAVDESGQDHRPMDAHREVAMASMDTRFEAGSQSVSVALRVSWALDG